MTTKTTLLLLLLITLFLVFNLCFYIRFSEQDWILATSVSLSATFLSEVWQSYLGDERRWASLSRKDEFIYFTGSVILLVSIILPIKQNMQILYGILFASTGFVITWTITRAFGSEDLIKKFWGNLYRRRYSKKDF